jgi:acetyltransferase-like isoleucine patch superfamily enzyme
MTAARFYVGKARALLGDWKEERLLLRRFPTARLDGKVRVVNPAGLELGDEVLIQHGAVLHCGGLAWSAGAGSIRIGDGSVISHNCVLYGAGGIEIGARFDCGPGSMIFSSRSLHLGEREERPGEPHMFARVSVGEDVTVYAGCVIGPGVTIGDGAAIGAGSVVLETVPPHTLVAGSPARKIRDLA